MNDFDAVLNGCPQFKAGFLEDLLDGHIIKVYRIKRSPPLRMLVHTTTTSSEWMDLIANEWLSEQVGKFIRCSPQSNSSGLFTFRKQSYEGGQSEMFDFSLLGSCVSLFSRSNNLGHAVYG